MFRKTEIASQLLKNKNGKPLNCKVLTTYAKGKGTPKRPYESDLSELREWLRTGAIFVFFHGVHQEIEISRLTEQNNN